MWKIDEDAKYYSPFNYVNELHNKIEHLQAEMDSLRTMITLSSKLHCEQVMVGSLQTQEGDKNQSNENQILLAKCIET